MIVIGIDQGIATFGFAVLDINDDEIVILESGSLKTAAKYPIGKRLLKLRTKVESLMDSHNPTLMGCERLFYNAPTGGRNKSLGMMHVNMATGMLHMLAFENEIDIKEYPPTSVKKMVTGNGRASKEEISQALEQFITKDVKTEHELDAIAIGITTYRKEREEELLGVKDKGNNKKNKTTSKKAKTTKGAETAETAKTTKGKKKVI